MRAGFSPADQDNDPEFPASDERSENSWSCPHRNEEALFFFCKMGKANLIGFRLRQ